MCGACPQGALRDPGLWGRTPSAFGTLDAIVKAIALALAGCLGVSLRNVLRRNVRMDTESIFLVCSFLRMTHYITYVKNQTLLQSRLKVLQSQSQSKARKVLMIAICNQITS